MKPLATASYAALATLLAACPGGSKLDGSIFDHIVTTVTPSEVVAGGTAQVSCGVAPESSNQWVHASDFVMRVEPVTGLAGGAVLEGTTITTTRSGTYRAYCALPTFGAEDAVGALLTVTAGDPVATRPDFDHNPGQVHATQGVRCVGVDRFGNPAELPFPEFTADPSLVFGDGTLTPNTVGTFPVTCGSPTKPGLPATPVDFHAIPGDPVTLELSADPDLPGYGVGAKVELSWTAYDNWGNAIADLPGTLTAPTQPAIALLDDELHQYRLDAEGLYHFSVRLDAPWASLTDDLDLLVDVTPPTVTITYPERGATLTESVDNPLVVRGKVTDAGGLQTFKINAQSVAVAADGTFSHPVESKWGLNRLDIVAVDKALNSTTLGPTYHYSDAYISFIDQDAKGLQDPDALVVLLAQGFFDDGVHDPADLNDVATLFEVLLSGIDISSIVDPLFANVNQTIPLASQQQRFDIIQGVSWVNVDTEANLIISLKTAPTTGIHAPRVDIDSRTGGLDFTMSIGDASNPALAIDLVLEAKLQLDITSEGCSPLGCLANDPVTATATADLTSSFSIASLLIDMAVDMDKTMGQPMHIDFSHVDTTIGNVHLAPIQDVVFNLHYHIPLVGDQNTTIALSDYIDLGQLFGSLFDPILTGAANLVPQLLNPLIEAAAGPLLSGLFDLLVIDTTIPLPSLFDATKVVDLGFHTELSTVKFTDDGGTVGIAAGLHTEKDIQRDPLGAIVRGDCLGKSLADLAWTWDPTVGIGVRTDLVNETFFAAWWGGLLNGPLDLSALSGGSSPIPVDNMQVELSWLLPPIVNDCEKSGLLAQVGDMYVTLTGDVLGSPVSVTMYVDLTTTVSFVSHPANENGNGQPAGLGVMLGALTGSEVEVMTLDDGGLGEIFDLRSILENLPSLLGGFITGQEIGPIQLPSTDLSTLLPGVAPGTSLGLGDLEVLTQEGYVILGGNLE
ncbi:MAG: hypothetical protein U1F43_10490 [Myxococcota bacterium]